MKFLILSLLFGFLPTLLLEGCGVKGKPLPPLTPPILGRGEPNYSRATQDVKIRKNGNLKNTDDWDDDSDFSSGKQK
jgi:hypothetical protein